MAIEDFGGSVLGKKIELLVADHQNKVDVGLGDRAPMVRESAASRRSSTSPIRASRSRWSGPREVAQSAGDLRFRLVVRPDRQGLLAQHDAVERRQLVERRRADAAAHQAEARQLLLHHRRLRLRRLARGRCARRRSPKAGGNASAACARRSTPPISARICCRRRRRTPRSSCSPTPAPISRPRSSRPTNSASRRRSIIATPITYLSDVNALGLPDRARPHLHAILVLGSQRRDPRLGRSASTTAPSACPTTTKPCSIPRCGIISRRWRRPARTTPSPIAKAMRDAPIHDVFTDNGRIREDGRVDLRPLPDEGEDARRVEISLGLSQGGRRESPPKRPSARPAPAAASLAFHRGESYESRAASNASRQGVALRRPPCAPAGKPLQFSSSSAVRREPGQTGTRCGSPCLAGQCRGCPRNCKRRAALHVIHWDLKGSWEGGEGRRAASQETGL